MIIPLSCPLPRPARAACSSESFDCSTLAGEPSTSDWNFLFFGNAITSRIDSQPSNMETSRSMPSAMPTVRRRAVLQGLQEEAELPLHVLIAHSQQIGRPCAARSGSWLRIEPEPISLPSRTRSYDWPMTFVGVLALGDVALHRPHERMMECRQLAGDRIGLEERTAHDPDELVVPSLPAGHCREPASSSGRRRPSGSAFADRPGRAGDRRPPRPSWRPAAF